MCCFVAVDAEIEAQSRLLASESPRFGASSNKQQYASLILSLLCFMIVYCCCNYPIAALSSVVAAGSSLFGVFIPKRKPLVEVQPHKVVWQIRRLFLFVSTMPSASATRHARPTLLPPSEQLDSDSTHSHQHVDVKAAKRRCKAKVVVPASN